MNKTSYLILRMAIGTSMMGHGLVRLPKLSTFSTWMTGSFKNSMLPSVLVLPFSYLLPFAEFGIGVLILIGLFSRLAFMAGALVMVMLIFGTCMVENWEAIPSQLIHVVFFAFLLQYAGSNTWSIENLLFKKQRS
jgi:thiosulfate dehydrogenase [quinone] large subunit